MATGSTAVSYGVEARSVPKGGGFHQVIFICHTPLVWELADRILSVGEGRVQSGNSEDAANNGGEFQCCPSISRS